MENLNFDKIYKEYKPQVLNVIRMKVKSNEQIDEICDDVFLKVWEHLNEYKIEKAQFNTWLFFITKNKVVDYFRQNNVKAQRYMNVDNFSNSHEKQVSTDNFFIGNDNADNLVENRELGSDLDKAFDTLKPNYKAVAELYLKEDLSYKEIAEQLNIDISNVKVTLMRAKAMLTKQLEKQRLMYA